MNLIAKLEQEEIERVLAGKTVPNSPLATR